tara:strand:+ start:296 stop:2548 length:2253 start_codon:yes stop_codon:yes gene_type:complete
MSLFELQFNPGVDKQTTPVGAINRWINSDNVRFRYGLPEKVGGWQSLLTDTICGVARQQHAFVDLQGNRYVAIGTDKFLLIYFEGQLHDITPFKSNNAGALTTFTINSIVTNNSNKNATFTTTTNHGLSVGDMLTLTSVTAATNSSTTAAGYDGFLYQVQSVPTPTTFILTLTQQETNAGAVIPGSASGTVNPYDIVGPANQTYGYGFGVGNFGGTVSSALLNDLDGALAANTAGNNGSATQIRLTSTTGFPASGTIAVGNELITYASIAVNELVGITRGAFGTATTGTSNGQVHNDGAIVTNATDFSGWGEAVEASTVTLEPGLWSLSNFGQVLVATIANGKTFTWNAGISARLSTHASTTTSGFETAIATGVGNPTASILTLISPTTRHLIHFGTETDIGDTSTQDNMFIRFSDQEGINRYTIEATNTAGSQRLQDGTKIIGSIVAKENILVWTDNALYTMKFVGAPFTFGFEQVGTNCGLIGKNAAIEIDGVAYWMSNNGFFAFDGTSNSLSCSVEDFVYDDFDTTKGQQVYAGINNLYTEVVWYYPTQGSTFNNRYVVHNYGEGGDIPMGNWYTGVNPNAIRTTWLDSLIYPRPYATAFNSTSTGTFPAIQGSTGLGQTVYFEHETGTDQVNPNGTTTILTSLLESYNFAINTQEGTGEFMLAMRRFLPDFKTISGSIDVTVAVSDYPQTTISATDLSPFVITSATTKVDTRARGRYASIKIENKNSGDSWRFGTFRADVQPDGRR